jgi:hypothetical protein
MLVGIGVALLRLIQSGKAHSSDGDAGKEHTNVVIYSYVPPCFISEFHLLHLLWINSVHGHFGCAHSVELVSECVRVLRGKLGIVVMPDHHGIRAAHVGQLNCQVYS